MGTNCQPCKTGTTPPGSLQQTINLSFNPHNVEYFSHQIQNVIAVFRKKYNIYIRDCQQYTLDHDRFYRGLIINKFKEGYGQYYTKDNVIFGLFSNDKPQGQILVVNGSKNYIKGYFLNGKIEGQALQKVGQVHFNGVYQSGQKIKGKLTTFQYIYEGQFKNNKFDGYGKLYYENGDKYEGSFKNGHFHGHGVYLSHLETEYRGQFQDGHYHGFGCFRWTDKCYYLGQYKKGQRNGYGKLITQGQKQFRGIWLNGQLIRQGSQKESQQKLFTKQSQNGSSIKQTQGLSIKLF